MKFETRAHNNYISMMVGNEMYLLPFGQNIADLQAGFKINETGYVIWNAVCDGCSDASIVARVLEYYEADEDDKELIQKDVRQFLSFLVTRGAYDFDEDAYDTKRYMIFGPLVLCYNGPEKVYNKYFSKFECDVNKNGRIDQQIRIHMRSEGYLDACGKNRGESSQGEILIQNTDVTIRRFRDNYVFTFVCMSGIQKMIVSDDGRIVDMFCRDEEEGLSENIFHALRFAFIVLAQKKGLFLFHSASILYSGKAWLFTGQSGAGKSTHTRLWQDTFGTKLVNGDLNLIGYADDVTGGEIGIPEHKEGCWMVYGQPWCGTSGICSSNNYPLGGITLIKKASDNEAHRLDETQSVLCVLRRLISPSWQKEQMMVNMDFAQKVAADIPVMELQCTKEAEAAYVMKTMIDNIEYR